MEDHGGIQLIQDSPDQKMVAPTSISSNFWGQNSQEMRTHHHMSIMLINHLDCMPYNALHTLDTSGHLSVATHTSCAEMLETDQVGAKSPIPCTEPSSLTKSASPAFWDEIRQIRADASTRYMWEYIYIYIHIVALLHCVHTQIYIYIHCQCAWLWTCVYAYVYMCVFYGIDVYKYR